MEVGATLAEAKGQDCFLRAIHETHDGPRTSDHGHPPVIRCSHSPKGIALPEQAMQGAELTHKPNHVLIFNFSGTAAIPLFLVLGGGLLPGNDGIGGESASAAGVRAQVQEEDPDPDTETTAEEVEELDPAVQEESGEAEELASDSELLAEGEGESALESYASGVAQPEPEMTGFINFRTRSRWAEDAEEDDHDLYAVVGADWVESGDDSWGVHLLLQGTWGLNSQAPGSIFYSVQDTYDDQLEGRIYHAFVDVPAGDDLRITRLGRMLIYDTPVTAHFDGAHFETAPVGPTQFVLGAYGGNSVHLFESWPSDETMGGVYTRFRPWDEGQLRVDYMRFEDDDRFGEGENDLVSTGLTHRIGKELKLDGNYSWLDGDSNDMRFKATWLWPEQDLSLRLSHYRLIQAQRNFAYELNPFFNFLNTYFPYDQSQVVLSKVFGKNLEIYAGLDYRRVDDEGDIGPFNRDFDRYYATAAFPDLLWEDSTLSLTGETWNSPGNDIHTWGLDLSSQVSEDTRASFGSYYALYKYFFDVDTEREDVRTYYAEIRNSVSESTNLIARYEFENEEIDSFHTLRLGVTWRF